MSLLALALALLVQIPAPADTTDAAEDEISDASDVVAEAGTYDTTEDDRPGLRFRPRIAPSALYSSNRGIGIGGGVGIRNIGWTGSDVTVDLRLQQRYQSADVTLFTADPFDTQLHALVSVGASTTERRRYYGLGPNTLPTSEINLFHDAAQAEVRVGYYPLGTTAIYLQPGLRFLFDHSGGVNPDGAGTLDDLPDEKSREAVEVAADVNRYGLSAGLELATDLRDWPAYPRRGFYGSIEHRRFFALDESKLTTSRYAATAIGYLPIRGRTTVLFRAVGILTRSGDANDDGVEDAIPFYYLPTLDDRVATAFKEDRLTGRDVVSAGAGIRAPIFDFLGVYGIDGVAMAYLGNAYDNVFEQFKPAISFREDAALDANGQAALRPSLALGLGLVNLDKERVVLGGMLGIGPGGVTLATLRVAYDLRDARPLFR